MSAEHRAGCRLGLAGLLRDGGQAAGGGGGADVLGFITAQRTGRDSLERVQTVEDAEVSAGVSTSMVARRLSIVSGFFAYLQARGDITAHPVPRGLPTRGEQSRPRQGVPLTRRTRRLPRILTPGRVRPVDRRAAHPPRSGDGRRWCSVACAAARSSGCVWRTCGWPSVTEVRSST